MLRVESIFLGQPDTVALNLLYSANMVAVSVDNFHVFADIHFVLPWLRALHAKESGVTKRVTHALD
jgi:hypothetical protein